MDIQAQHQFYELLCQFLYLSNSVRGSLNRHTFSQFLSAKKYALQSIFLRGLQYETRRLKEKKIHCSEEYLVVSSSFLVVGVIKKTSISPKRSLNFDLSYLLKSREIVFRFQKKGFQTRVLTAHTTESIEHKDHAFLSKHFTRSKST